MKDHKDVVRAAIQQAEMDIAEIRSKLAQLPVDLTGAWEAQGRAQDREALDVVVDRGLSGC